MQNYKARSKNIFANTHLSEENKRSMFNALIQEKNVNLKSLLSEQQWLKITPISERKSNINGTN